MQRNHRGTRAVAVLVLVLAASCSDPGPNRPSNPTSLTIISGDAQSATVMTTLAVPIAIRVADEVSRATPRVSIRFAAVNGGQTSAATATSDDSGFVHLTWTLGSTAGDQTLTANLASDAGVGAVVHATAQPDLPAALHILDTLASTVRVADSIAADVHVALTDRFDNTSPVAGVTVAAALDGGVGTRQVSGTVSAVTNAGGIAHFARLAIVGDTGVVSLMFRAASLTPASTSFHLVPGAIARLEPLTALNVSGIVAQNGPALSVRATDAGGNRVAGAHVTFTFANSNVDVVTGADGVASYPPWTLPTKAGAYQVVAIGSSTTSVAFNVKANAGRMAAIAVIGSGDLSANAGDDGPPIRMRAADSFDNPVAGAVVSFAIVNSMTIADVTTDTAGVALLAGWKVPSVAATYMIVASAAGVTSAPVSFIVKRVALYHLTPFSMPTSATVTNTLQVAVQIVDDAGHPAGPLNVEWSVDGVGVDNYTTTVSAPSSFADNSGISRATLQIGTKSGVVNVHARVVATGTTGDFAVTVRPGAFVGFVVTVSDEVARANTPLTATVRPVDSWYNGIPGISLRAVPGIILFTTIATPPISPANTVTGADGSATFSMQTAASQPGTQYWVIEGLGSSALVHARVTADRGFITPWEATPIANLTWKIGSPVPTVGFIVTQADGFPAENVLVTFTLGPGNGAFSGGTAGGVFQPQFFSGLTTVGEGLVSVTWNPPSTPGTYTMRVQSQAPNDVESPLVVTLHVVP